MARKHWSEVMQCQCGMRFRSYAAEAYHRHNFPALCRKPGAKGHSHKRALAALVGAALLAGTIGTADARGMATGGRTYAATIGAHGKSERPDGTRTFLQRQKTGAWEAVYPKADTGSNKLTGGKSTGGLYWEARK